MKVLVEYEVKKDTDVIKLSEIRKIDDDCYPRVIGKISKEIHANGFMLTNIRCLDPHPKDLK